MAKMARKGHKPLPKRLWVPILIFLQCGIVCYVINIFKPTQLIQLSPVRLSEIIEKSEETRCVNEVGDLDPIELLGDNYGAPLKKDSPADNENDDDDSDMPLCAEFPEHLEGQIDVNLDREPDCLGTTAAKNPLLVDGGFYKPAHCKARHKVAIVIPFRRRDEHLLYFLQYMHPILQRQQLQYKVFVIDQLGNETFNKDMLMNVGFVLASAEGFDCFVFHDVDLILTNDKCLYACQSQPVHFAHNVDKFNGLAYHTYFGGAVALTDWQFRKINGFPNNFLGWGGEDDVIYNRVKDSGMSFYRIDSDVAKYKMVHHERDAGNEVNPERFFLLENDMYEKSGLDTLEHSYEIFDVLVHPLFTKYRVDVNLHSSEPSWSPLATLDVVLS